MNYYKALRNQSFFEGDFSLVPIRFEDRFSIMKWRNEQIYHLRQDKPLTQEDQDLYFNTIVSSLFEQEKPSQLLFSFLKNNELIGYGGLVHINWLDRHAEISFVMNTELQANYFEEYWSIYLRMLEKLAFNDLGLHKLFTYAFDVRPQLYTMLENNNYYREAVLQEHCYFQGKYIDVIIHAKKDFQQLRPATIQDAAQTFDWAKNPEIRRYSFNTDEIKWEEHLKWFSGKLENPNVLYLILENALGKALGSVRLDVDGDTGLISYLIDSQYHKRNLGTILLVELENYLQNNKLGITRLLGLVLPENLASIKIFQKLGYQKINEDHAYTFEKLLS